MKVRLKRILCFALTVSLCIGLIPMQVFAEGSVPRYLPETGVEEEILRSDVFYMASSSAQLEEGSNAAYLLRIARGGDGENEASVRVRIADLTASYGEDYTVRVHATGETAENPEDNFSLMEMMETQPYVQSELGTDEELAELLEEDEEGQAVLNEGIQSAVDFLDAESGLSEKYPDGYPQAELDPVQQARAEFTGVNGASQRLTTGSDMFQDLQSVADVLTTAVVGVDVTLEFAPGETEQYLELIPRNNRKGDGDRIFYLVLNNPEGGTTISAADACAVTIVDDEEQEPAVVSFSASSYSHTPGEETVTVTVERSGAMNTVISATVRTTGEGSAVMGRDYSQVERSLLFPFGVSSLTVDIPVCTEFFSGEADFGLSLEADTGCRVEMGSAVVSMAGTFVPTASLKSVPGSTAAPAVKAATTDRNNLSTIHTLDAIDLSQPVSSGHQDNYYGGNNHWESDNKRWLLEWMDSTIFRDRKGTVGAVWQLSQEEGRYWIAGAEVVWARTGSCAEITVDIDGCGEFSSYFSDWKSRGDDGSLYDLYRSTAGFDKETVYMFPTERSIREKYSYSPKWISFYNRGRCDDCNRLWVYSVRPILRPFQFNLLPAEPLEFLQPDGTRAADDGTATQASIVNSGTQIVCFVDESFTVTQPAGSNIQQYARLSGLTAVTEEGKAICSLGTNSDASDKDIIYTLSKENLTTLKKKAGTTEFRKMIKENKALSNVKTAGYPNYCQVNVQPSFAYIDSSVTLRNPYEFPVTMVISGTSYTLQPGASKKLTFHLGDQLALTEVRAEGLLAESFASVGAVTQYKRSGAEAKYEEAHLNFVDQGAVYPGGSNTGDHRLCCRELVIEPNLQEKNNRVIVRVRTDELRLFSRENSAGLLSQNGTVNGEYTEFLMAGAEQTFNGKLYPITAVPNDGYICVWQDPITGLTYEGDTFYFTAGEKAERNVITLSAASVAKSITLSGTLRYMNYNLHTRDAGGASAVPASGAVVAAGSASATADETGAFQTGEISVSGVSGHYLRYLVSVNGAALVQETVIPAGGGKVDVSRNFSDGVSPVSSDIFSNMLITASYPASSGYSVNDGTYLPIVDAVTAMVDVRLRPADYTVTSTDETGVKEQKLRENPKSVLLAVYDASGQVKGTYPAAECEYDDFAGVYSVSIPVDFAVSEDGGDFAVAPGDKLYLRLTTDRLAQAGSGGEDYNYTYSDIFTGYTFIAPTSYEPPVEQGIESPVVIEYPNLPLIGTAGMNLDFPFVTVGWTKIDRGYRMYIGVSPVQIYDTIKGAHTSSFSGDDGTYWSSLFKLSDPFKSFGEGMKAAYSHVKGIGNGGVSTGSLGSPQWRFDLILGAYFDFYNPSITGGTSDEGGGFYFAGVGFYMSATLGFKVAWYFVIPVVCIPAYIGIDLQGMVMGFLGAEAGGEATVTLDQARHEKVNFNDSLDEFSGNVRGAATAQLSVGVGLCGTLGIRATGIVRVIGEYAPSNIVPDCGAYIGLSAGIVVDLFLFSLPLYFELAHTAFGSFEEYEKGIHETVTPELKSVRSADGGENGNSFVLREGSERDSTWMGSRQILQSSLTPSSSKVLSDNAYERGDAQVITLSDGTVFLAYIDSDNEKGPYQRTTLMLATYKDGQWSRPVPVCEDDTADFQPSISEAKDGRVLVAWISTGANDITEETSTVEYLNSMEVFAAFASVGEDGSVTVGEKTQLTTGTNEKYYDANPTAVCDKVTGDAIVYYVKSGSATENIEELANPYTNDCVICYMYYNAETDEDQGKTIPAGWLSENYYSGEYSGTAPDIAKWGGQRFLNGPTFTDGDGKKLYYAIPDFTAIGYNGLAVFAYTVDTDGNNDTDADKELYLQVFNFRQHELKYRIQLTDDDVSDAMPQFFRTKDAGLSTEDETTHTKLFWYRDGKGVCYIDVTRLIQNGIQDDGTIVPHDEDYTDEAGRKHFHYTDPHYVGTVSDDSKASQMADFRVAEDENGSLYVVWTEGVTGEDDSFVQQIFAMGLFVSPGEEGEETGNTGWSKPIQLTKGNRNSDELAVTACEDGLMVVHNSFLQELVVREHSERFEGVLDYDPIQISQTRLTATLMKPCGAVETENIRLAYAEEYTESEDDDISVELPEGGRSALVTVRVANNGLTTAEGYQVTLYAEQDGVTTELGNREISEPLMPTSSAKYSFAYVLPENVEGLSFRAVTREKRGDGAYYSNSFTYETEPLEERAAYAISNVETAQTAEGFRMSFTLTNTGNAAGENDSLRLRLNGPFNLDMQYEDSECLLYTGKVGRLEAGESRDYEIAVDVPAKMLEKYGFIDASAVVVNSAGENISENMAVAFSLTGPYKMMAEPLTLAVDETETPIVTMELGALFGGSDVSFAVEDQTVAAVQDGKILGIAPGTTTLYAIHTVSGAVVSTTVTVTEKTEKPVKHYEDFADLPENAWYKEGVSYALEQGLMEGFDDTTFSPDTDTTRAMLVTMLWRLEKEPKSEKAMAFTDVPENQWYTEAIRWASDTGLVNGVSENSFRPNAVLSREQLVTLLYRYAKMKGSGLRTGSEELLKRYADGDTVSAWAKEAMCWALNTGLVNGVGGNRIDPGANASRAQIATIFMRFLLAE